MKVRIEAIERAKQRIEQMEVDYLLERGWKHSCQNPGSQWLWEKTYDDRVYRCSQGTALNIQGDLHDESPEIFVATGEGSGKGFVIYVSGFPIWLEANDEKTAQVEAKEVLELPKDAPDLPVYDPAEDEDA